MSAAPVAIDHRISFHPDEAGQLAQGLQPSSTAPKPLASSNPVALLKTMTSAVGVLDRGQSWLAVSEAVLLAEAQLSRRPSLLRPHLRPRRLRGFTLLLQVRDQLLERGEVRSEGVRIRDGHRICGRVVVAVGVRIAHPLVEADREGVGKRNVSQLQVWTSSRPA